MSRKPLTLDDVRAASMRISSLIHRTPIETCASIDQLADRAVFFKCEHQQRVGAFKFRGAANAIFKLPHEIAAKGVVTHSSGNHGQAVALAARLRGIPSYVVMPTSASAVKRRAVEGYGARLTLCAPSLEAREAAAAAVVEKTGGTLIPPYDHEDVIAGQGTATLELLEQVRPLDAIVAPVGGGGLISGTCIAAKSLYPTIRIYAAEPTGADDAARSKAAGTLIPQTSPKTIADGLLTSLGTLTWPIIRDQVDEVITVTDEETIAAMRLSWERGKLLIEPSAAVAVAAVLSDRFKELTLMRRVGVILTGGNVDLDHLPW